MNHKIIPHTAIFYITKIKGISKTRHKVKYSNLPSAMRLIHHNVELPEPHPINLVVELKGANKVKNEQHDSIFDTYISSCETCLFKDCNLNDFILGFEFVQKCKLNFWILD